MVLRSCACGGVLAGREGGDRPALGVLVGGVLDVFECVPAGVRARVSKNHKIPHCPARRRIDPREIN